MQIPNRRRIPRNYDVLAAVASVDIRACLAYTPALHMGPAAWKLRVEIPMEMQNMTTNPFSPVALASPQKLLTMEPQYPYSWAVHKNPACLAPLRTIPEPNMASGPEFWESLGHTFTGIANLRRCISRAKDIKCSPLPVSFGEFLYGTHSHDFAIEEAQKMTATYLDRLIDYYHLAHGVNVLMRPEYVFNPEHFYGWLFEREVELVCPPTNGILYDEVIGRARYQAIEIINSLAAAHHRPVTTDLRTKQAMHALEFT